MVETTEGIDEKERVYPFDHVCPRPIMYPEIEIWIIVFDVFL